MRAFVWAATAGLLLAGCVGDLERNVPEPAVYVLAAPAAADGPPLAAVLLVLRPSAAPALATDRIATRWPGNRIDYYAGARWGGELRQVVQSALVEGARGSGRLRSVEADPGYFRSTHVLGVGLSRFEADYTAGEPPIARVELTATVARFRDRETLASWTVKAEEPAAQNTLSAVTAALDAAFARAGAEVLDRSAAAIAADK